MPVNPPLTLPALTNHEKYTYPQEDAFISFMPGKLLWNASCASALQSWQRKADCMYR